VYNESAPKIGEERRGKKMYAGTVKWFDAQKGYGFITATMVKETFLFTSQQLKAMALRRLMKAKRLNSKFPEALRGLKQLTL